MFKVVTFSSVVFVASLMAYSPAEAATFGGASSEWSNPNPVTSVNKINVDILGFNSVTWGTLIPSGLGFKSNSNVEFSFGEMFNVGKLRFLNTLDLSSSILDDVDLGLTLDFLDPDFTTSVTFDLDITSTPDSLGNPILCKLSGGRRGCPVLKPDSVAITPNPLLGTTAVAANGRKYKVDLFFAPGQLVANELHFEDAYLTAKVSQVPEPSTLLGFLAVGALVTGRALKKTSKV